MLAAEDPDVTKSQGGGPEWVGGRRRMPFYVMEKPPFRPDIVLWMELPSVLLLAAELVHPEKEPLALARTLRAAMARPPVGPPRQPSRVRVGDEVDAAAVRAGLAGSDIEVVVAPTPELDAVMEDMIKGLAGTEGKVEPSYFEGGRVPGRAVADLFSAARLLYALAPWKRFDDNQTIRLDIPALGVEGACVSVIGALGESFGFVVFPSARAYGAFIAAGDADPGRRRPLDLGTTTLSLTFDPASELPPRMRREALENGWPVAGPNAYPRVEHRDRDGVPRPLEERDVEIAARCALALAAFVPQVRAKSGRLVPFSATFIGDDEVAVRLTFPYEAYFLFEPVTEQDGEPERSDILPKENGSRAGSRGPGSRPPAGPPKPGRNAPCWCGSGRKYKLCHYNADRSGGGRGSPPADPDRDL